MGNCMSCGGAMKKKMAKGGSIAAGIPYATGAGQTDGKNGMMKKGGTVTKRAKLAALAAPKNKITRADVIAGAKKNARKKKK
jgi:hypothetical protein